MSLPFIWSYHKRPKGYEVYCLECGENHSYPEIVITYDFSTDTTADYFTPIGCPIPIKFIYPVDNQNNGAGFIWVGPYIQFFINKLIESTPQVRDVEFIDFISHYDITNNNIANNNITKFNTRMLTEFKQMKKLK